MMQQTPPPDDELPPPPSDIADQTNNFPEIKVVRSGALATVRRAFTIFEKDLRTMAKHGLVSSVILLVFLTLVFYIMSYTMNTVMNTDMFGDGDGEGMTLPGATESVPPMADAGSDVSIDAGIEVDLDGSGSTDNAAIVYWSWHLNELGIDTELYGETVHHTFEYAGDFNVTLTVVDSSWNFAEDSMMVHVSQSSSDTENPSTNYMPDQNIPVGSTVTFDGSSATDNIGIVNWTWSFDDIIPRLLYGESEQYTFENAGNYWVKLIARDAAGNAAEGGTNVNVQPMGDDWSQPYADPGNGGIATVGETVNLDASNSRDDNGTIVAYTWYISHNATLYTLSGMTAHFTPSEWGPYEVTLAVRDNSGNAGSNRMTIVALPVGMEVSGLPWTSTPLGADISFNLLTYVYGIALLASVIFIGGLFAKGFAHEIQKGTIKVLFFGPISVTTMVFSKILYPIIIGPLFIIPLTMIALSPFGQPVSDLLIITLVAYGLAVLTMVSAAYGSCLIYLGAKRMVLKPTVVSRIFMYLSLLATMTVFEWMSYLFDMWFDTNSFGGMYTDYGSAVAFLSPFHQGGVFLSNMIVGTAQTPDWIVFAIPVSLIVLGVMASHRLYPDMFSRE